MSSTLYPSCALDTGGKPDCALPLRLRDALDSWRRDATHGSFDTGRYRCRYVVWGRGPTLVLIPGIACAAMSFAMLISRLQSHFRCVAFDLPDGVDDGASLRKYRHDDLVSDLFALLDHLHIHECSLLGFSFGATIALAALHREPGRFWRGILQAGFARRTLSRAEVFCATWARFLPGRLGHVPLARRIIERNHRTPFLMREADVWDFFVAEHLRVPIAALAARVMMLHRLDLRPLLPSIDRPMLLVCGDRDPLISKECEADLQSGLPIVARAELEQCGHLPHLTHPEVLAEIVQHFAGGQWTVGENSRLERVQHGTGVTERIATDGTRIEHG